MAAKLTILTHKIATQLHLVAESLYHLQFLLQVASTETFGYNLVYKKEMVKSYWLDGRHWRHKTNP
jgi:hypothetical protein